MTIHNFEFHPSSWILEVPFGDPVRAKEQALAMHSAGTDIIFTATAGGDFGVFEAAKENKLQGSVS